MSTKEGKTAAQPGRDDAAEIKRRSQLRLIWFRFKKNKMALVGLTIIVILALVAMILSHEHTGKDLSEV